MTGVDISAGKKRIAYATPEGIKVFDVESRCVTHSIPIEYERAYEWNGNPLAWDAGEPSVLHLRRHVFMHGPSKRIDLSWIVAESKATATNAPPRNPVRNYRRWSSGSWGGRDDWGVPLPMFDQQRDLELFSMHGLYARVRVTKNDEHLLTFRNNYGLVRISYGGPREATFLSEYGTVLCEGRGILYVLDVFNKRVAALAGGRKFLVVDPKFTASFAQE